MVINNSLSQDSISSQSKMAEGDEKGTFATATLPEPLDPISRADKYEHPLQEWFDEHPGIGTVDGGGTLLGENGIESVDVSLLVFDESKISEIIAKLEELGAPEGSRFLCKGQTIIFGKYQGLKIVFPFEEVQKSSEGERNMNFVMNTLNDLLEGVGEISSWRETKQATTLYAYGRSHSAMEEKIRDFMSQNPLCATADVSRISN